MARKSYIFRDNWMEVLDSIEDINDRWTFMQWISAYALDGEEPAIPAYLKPLAAMFRASIDETQEKYDTVVEKRKTAAAQRWQKKMDENTDKPSVNNANGCKPMQTDANDAFAFCMTKSDMQNANAQFAMQTDANDAVSVSDSVSVSVSVDSSDKSSESNNPPQAPQGAEDAACAAEGFVFGKDFGRYWANVALADEEIPEPIKQFPGYERQWLWRKAEGMDTCMREVEAATAKCRSGIALEDALRGIWTKYTPTVSFQIFKTAAAIVPMDTEARSKICAYISEQRDCDTDFWLTMQEKIAYIKANRTKIHSIPALLRARKKT